MKESPEFIRRTMAGGEPEEFASDPIVTALDTRTNKRLIVDGIHRSVILTNEGRSKVRVPSAELVECYGSRVSHIFPFDFSHL
jgi:hypothetical protein